MSDSNARRTVRRRRWLADAVIAGFVATGASAVILVVAFAVAEALGEEQGGGQFRSWLWELTHNQVVSFSQGAPALAILLHLVFGLIWALVYAYWFEYRVGASGWRAGMLFGLLPYAASLLALLPAAGVGLLGFALSAGPLPAIGNLVLHLAYGGVLGQLYDASADEPATAADVTYDEPMEAPAVEHSEAWGAAGIIGGVLVGAVMGFGLAILLPPTLPGEAFGGWSLALAAGGVLAGGGVGAIVGSFAGLPGNRHEPAEESLGPDPFEHVVLPFLIPPAVIVFAAGLISVLGLTLLSLSKFGAVGVALLVTAVIAFGAWLLSSRPPGPSSPRDTVSQSGH